MTETCLECRIEELESQVELADFRIAELKKRIRMLEKTTEKRI